jgi:hypothetical protein
LRPIGRELLVIVGFVGASRLVTIVSGFVFAHVVGPAMSGLMWFLITAFLDRRVQPDASTGLPLTSLVGVVVFLAGNVVIETAASVLFLRTGQNVLRGTFHAQIPLRVDRLRTRGSRAFAWAESHAADDVAPRGRGAYPRRVPTVELTSHLYAFFPQLAGRPLSVDAATVAEVVAAMERLAPGFAFYVSDEAGRLRQHVLVYVGNERVTDRATLSDPVGPDARVLIVQALSGG